jgi:hypothetical protein
MHPDTVSEGRVFTLAWQLDAQHSALWCIACPIQNIVVQKKLAACRDAKPSQQGHVELRAWACMGQI